MRRQARISAGGTLLVRSASALQGIQLYALLPYLKVTLAMNPPITS